MVIVRWLGLYDWDLNLKAKTDGTFGLEGLKYGSPREYEGGTGQSGVTGQNNGEEANRESVNNRGIEKNVGVC